MQYRMLGGLAVTDGDRPVDLGGRKQRAVLAALLFHLGRPVSPGRLQDDVWGDDPPAQPEASLQAYVSNLRRALEPGRKPREAPRVLVTRPAGYALVADRADVDVMRFEDLVAGGHAALARSDPARAAAVLDEAMALWAGPPLPEMVGERWVDDAVARLEALHAEALESRFEAGLALGEHRALVAALERAVASHPFRERLRAHLALALYRCGRQRDALAALADARTMLVEEVGIEPGPELRRLESDILVQSPSLDPPPSPTPRPAPGPDRRDTHTSAAPGAPTSAPTRPATATADPASTVAGPDHASAVGTGVDGVGTAVAARGTGESPTTVASPGAAAPAPTVASPGTAETSDPSMGTDPTDHARTAAPAPRAPVPAGDDRSAADAVTGRAPGVPAGGGAYDSSGVADGTATGARNAAVPGAGFRPAVDGRFTRAHLTVSAGADLGESTFVGRDGELGVLLALAGGARTAGRPVVISGEPGIGKTRLVEELLARLPADTTVAWGRCPESAASAAYWPCIQIGRQLEGADALDADLVGALLPSDDTPRTDDASADRLALHVSVAQALASATRPLVLVIDDLQWADPASLRTIEFVAGALRELPVLLVVTVRPVTPDAPAALVESLGELARQPGAVRIDLTGLGHDDVHRWLVARGEGRVDPEVTTLVHGRTAGNPFFVGELVELLASDGRLADVDAARRGPAVPAAVQDVVRRRVSRLPVSTQQLLATASVVGRAFDVDVLGAVAGAPPLDVLDRLDPALVAELVVEADVPGRFQFSHALVAETLVAELSPARRARAHAATASALADLRAAAVDAHLAELAHHALAGAAAGTAEAAYEWSVRAAQQAAEHLAHEDAAEHWGRAVRALELARRGQSRPADSRARYEALLEQARAWIRVDDIAAGYRTLMAALDLALSLGDPQLVAQAAATANVEGLWQSGEVTHTSVEMVGVLERALAALPDAPTAERALALGALSDNAYWLYSSDRLDAVTAEAVAIARRVGNPVVLGRALQKRAQALWRAATLDARREAVVELAALAEEHEVPPALEAVARFGTASVDWEVGEVARAEAEVDRARAIAGEIGSPALMTQLDYFRSSIAAFTGRLAEAEALADRAYELYRRTRRWEADALHAALLLPVYLEQGRMADIDRMAPAMLDSDYSPWLREAYALALVENARLDDAADLVGDVLPPLVDCWLYLGVVGAALRVRAALGDQAATARLADELRPYRGRMCAAGTGDIFGDIDLGLAMAARLVGDEDAVRDHVDASVATLTRAGSGPDLVRALLLRAEVSALEQAAADRERAAALVDRLGLVLLAGRLP